MVDKFLSDLFKPAAVMAIEVTLLPGDQFAFSGVQLSVKKGICVIERSLPVTREINELLAVFNNDLPVALAVSGRGILHKKVMAPGSDIQKNLLAILPNAKAPDFYIQQFHIEQDIIYSLIRKQTLHDLLALFKNAKLAVTHVVLGGLSIDAILPLIRPEKDDYVFGGHCVRAVNASVVDYRYEKNEYRRESVQLDDEWIEESLLVPYGTGIQALAASGQPALEIEALALERSEQAHKRFFKIFGAGALIVFLVVLLINFFLFNHYNARYLELSGNRTRFSDYRVNLDSVSRKISARQSFLNNAGWMKPSMVSFYADEIGASIPASIRLTELSVNPYQETRTRVEKKIVFDPGKITIAGACNTPTDLNPWIRNMKQMPWVGAVEIQNYTFDNMNGKGKFVINLAVRQQ